MNDLKSLEIVNICPECFTELTSEDVSHDGNWGLCRKCDGFFRIEESLSIPQIPPRPEKPSRVHLKITRSDDTLTLEEPPIRGKWGWLFMLCLLFFGGMMVGCFFCALFAGGGGEPPNPIAFFCMGLFWVIPFSFGMYYVLMFWFYHRTYFIDRNEFRIEGRLFSLRFHEKVGRSHLWGLRSDWAPNQIGTMFSLRWLYDKKILEMLCRSSEEQQWASAEINDFLDATAPERLCCPSCNRGTPDTPDAQGELTCIWCGAKCFREEAATLGEMELTNPYRSDYDLVRPLETPIRIEQSDTELHVKTFRKGIQTFWEKFSVSFFMALMVAVPLTLLPGVFFGNAEVLMFGGIIVTVLLGFSFLLWLLLDRFWEEFSMEIDSEEIRLSSRCPLRKPKTLLIPRDDAAHCVEAHAHERCSNDFRFQQTGKYAFALINGENRVIYLLWSREETQWLLAVVNRFLHRTSPKATLVQVHCPHCRTFVSLEHWHTEEKTLPCSNCGAEVRIEDFVADFRPDPLKRPDSAWAKVEKIGPELVIEYPSRFEHEFSKWEKIFFRCLFLAFFLFIVGFNVFMIQGCVNAVQFFFQVFDPLQAILYSLFIILFFAGTFNIGLPLLVWAMANGLMTSRTITFHRDRIVSERRCLFRRIRSECVLEPGFEPKERKRTHGFNFRLWYKPSYWLDGDPAWDRDHLVLSENPQILLPCRSDEEKEWLKAVINDFV